MSVGWVDSYSAPALTPDRGDARRAVLSEPPFARDASRSRGGDAVPIAAASAARPLPTEIGFLAAYGVPAALLQYAATMARRQGVSADAFLLAEGLLAEETFYRALAHRLDVAFIEGDIDLAAASDPQSCAQNGFARLAESARGLLWVFAPTGAGVARLIGAARNARGRPQFALTTRRRFLDALRRASAREIARMAAHSAERADPSLCVRPALSRRLLALAIGGNVLALGCAVGLAPQAVSLGVALCYAILFLASVLLRLLACAASYEAQECPQSLADAALPHYTVIVALYKEAAVARQLSRAIDRFDYPRAKLDVKFVVERDDLETAAALRACGPRTPHEIIVAPPGGPRTKPNALNVATPFAAGSLVAVYDAEDLPEPRQLRRAAAIFAASPPSLACLQASLVIDNSAASPMTALYAIDYAALFDVHNRGLCAMGLPLFLGGTSNHFRMDALREVGFWDADNVTEDADLGLRLARAGYRVDTFASQMDEEAPTSFRALLGQRSRWMKGWLQTALVHCRDPQRLVADLGARRAFAVLAMFTGGFASPILGLPMTALLFSNALFGTLLTPQTPLDVAQSTLWCFLAVAGAAAVLWPLIVGMRRRKLTASWPALLYLPLWMAMLTLAAWRALIELWRRPYHWQKTEHGLTPRGVGAGCAGALETGALSCEQPAFE